MRDSRDMFDDLPRGRFGDYDNRNADVERVKMFDTTLVLRQERATSIAITQTDAANEKWIFLPLAMIEYRKLNTTTVEVTMPERLAKDKGLI